jgi:hypothetical protein
MPVRVARPIAWLKWKKTLEVIQLLPDWTILRDEAGQDHGSKSALRSLCRPVQIFVLVWVGVMARWTRLYICATPRVPNSAHTILIFSETERQF